mgnify:CR=1 FL=1
MEDHPPRQQTIKIVNIICLVADWNKEKKENKKG